MIKRPSVIIALVVLLLIFQTVTYSAIRNVPADFATIQEAIHAADSGDLVLVAPNSVNGGPYFENIDFLGKAITVKSSQGPLTTTIDGKQAGPVVTFADGEGLSSKLEGFTITNGDSEEGGGIHCSFTSPKIIGNIISNNRAQNGGGIFCYYCDGKIQENTINYNNAPGDGGGIYTVGGDPLIENNSFTGNSTGNSGSSIYCVESDPLIQGNTMQQNTGTWAGGVACFYGAYPTISNNVIKNNRTTNYGGAIYCYISEPLISNNVMQDNDGGYGGGAIFLLECSPEVSHNIISNNKCDVPGGGILLNDSFAYIHNNLIYDNEGDKGGGIDCASSSHATIIHNTIFGNSALRGGGIYLHRSSPEITNCIVWGNSASVGKQIRRDSGSPVVSFCDVKGGYEGIGNLNSDPLFVDKVNDDFRLRINSPCVDTGTDEMFNLPYTDFELDYRVIDGDMDGDAYPDMGADELLPEIAARFGTVGATAVSLSNALLLNGSPGDNKRVIAAVSGKGLNLKLIRPPSSPATASYALYWIWWEPGIDDIAIQPFNIGTSCIPMPLSNLINGQPTPPPICLANTIGHPWLLGSPMIYGAGMPPCTIFNVESLPAGTYAFQGYILDNASMGPGVSVTNGIVLRVE